MKATDKEATDKEAAISAMEKAVEAKMEEWTRSLLPFLYGAPGERLFRRYGASMATLRRRVGYGGRKGRRADRRLYGRR